MEARNLADLYDLPTVEWNAVAARLAGDIPQAPDTGGPNRHTFWLTTINADGTPHTTGIGAEWADGAFYFETGERSRKARNLARDPRCGLVIALHEFDLVVEGTAEKVVDPEVVARLAAQWAAGGWPCEVDESGIALTAPFSAPSAGPPPWAVYKMTVQAATVLSTVEPGGATRWTF